MRIRNRQIETLTSAEMHLPCKRTTTIYTHDFVLFVYEYPMFTQHYLYTFLFSPDSMYHSASRRWSPSLKTGTWELDSWKTRKIARIENTRTYTKELITIDILIDIIECKAQGGKGKERQGKERRKSTIPYLFIIAICISHYRYLPSFKNITIYDMK
jgi:hypothetical protein